MLSKMRFIQMMFIGRRAACTVAGLAFATALFSAPLTSFAADLKRIAVLEFGLIEDIPEPAKYEEQQKRLKLISDQMRTELEEKGLYDVIDNEPAAAMIKGMGASENLYSCNGCEIDIAKKLGAERVMTAWVQKVSNLILNLNIEIKDVSTGEVKLKKSVDIRGNTDIAWQRGITYMVRDMVEKKQGGR